MRPDYPIQCRCVHRTERFQLAFARAAMQKLPPDEETMLEPTKDGLIVLARTELALERVVATLRAAYEDDLHVEPPKVRYLQGESVEEPHMGVRILCTAPQFEAVRRDLRMRGATFVEEQLTADFGVVRATAPLASLLGYPARLRRLTSEQGKLVMWLSHYAPMNEPPTGGDAA